MYQITELLEFARAGERRFVLTGGRSMPSFSFFSRLNSSTHWFLRCRDFVVDESKPTVLQPKIRTIDRYVLTEGGMLPLSALDAEFRTYRDNYLRTRASTISLRLAD
jgi:hypothetical protein